MLTLQDWLQAVEIMPLKTDEKGKAKTNWNKDNRSQIKDVREMRELSGKLIEVITVS